MLIVRTRTHTHTMLTYAHRTLLDKTHAQCVATSKAARTALTGPGQQSETNPCLLNTSDIIVHTHAHTSTLVVEHMWSPQLRPTCDRNRERARAHRIRQQIIMIMASVPAERAQSHNSCNLFVIATLLFGGPVEEKRNSAGRIRSRYRTMLSAQLESETWRDATYWIRISDIKSDMIDSNCLHDYTHVFVIARIVYHSICMKTLAQILLFRYACIQLFDERERVVGNMSKIQLELVVNV